MNATLDSKAYLQKYGPWAVITGGSDGTGAAFAHQLAALGFNLLLIARRQEPLSNLASTLTDQYGITTRTASIDLYKQSAGQKVLEAAEGLDVGLFVSNAGADTNNTPFIDAPLNTWQQLINRNILVVVEAVYGFANAMRNRGRGGILLMSSASGLGGQPGLSIYGATKAFDLNFAETLWAELTPLGIDVLGGACPAMSTPTLMSFFQRTGVSIPNLHEPEEVVATLLQKLTNGPIHIFTPSPDGQSASDIEKSRRAQIESRIKMAARLSSKN